MPVIAASAQREQPDSANPRDCGCAAEHLGHHLGHLAVDFAVQISGAASLTRQAPKCAEAAPHLARQFLAHRALQHLDPYTGLQGGQLAAQYTSMHCREESTFDSEALIGSDRNGQCNEQRLHRRLCAHGEHGRHACKTIFCDGPDCYKPKIMSITRQAQMHID